MVTGVTAGFAKVIEIYGVGYRAQKQGRKLTLQMGFSHPVEVEPPEGVEFSDVQTFTPTSANTWLSARFSVLGTSKEQVGEVAAHIRGIRPVEPYKGKGIKYAGEKIRRKAGKAGKAAGKGKGGR
jgi:large subunit ribosomal protein L6